MIRRLAVACGMIVLCVCAAAQDTEDPLAEANVLYRDGAFAEAASAYRDALEAGWDGPRSHYNLANALYRSDRIGEAIAHYQAALTLAPRDPDIRANLNRALRDRPQGRPAPSASWLHATASRIAGFFTLSEFAAMAAVCWWAALAAVAALLLGMGTRRRVRRVAIALGILVLIAAAFAIGRWWGYHAVERAVVGAESARLRTGPGDSFEVALTVQEGWMARVVREDAGWAEVLGEGGAAGWVPVAKLVIVERSAGGAPEG